ncbi:MAG: peptidyl-prolyl cis-trans isomerase [Gemmatimonadota bacterium]
MMTELRRNTATIMWIVIIAFVALIVVEWGADFSGTRGGGSTDAVGVVNGQTISLRYFQEALRNAARLRQRDQDRDQQRDDGSLVRELWDQMVGEILLRQEIDRLGVDISDEELAFYTRTQPPPGVREIPAFQTEGEFDPVLYNQFLNDRRTYEDPNNKAFVMQVEGMQRTQLLNHRLQRLILEGVRVTPAEVREAYADRNERARVAYVVVAPAAVADDEVSATDAEIQAYYDGHRSEYEHPEQVRASYVVFPRLPSAADSVQAQEEIERVRKEILSGRDFAEAAGEVSEDEGSAANGGELGVFGRGRMVKAFEDAAFALEVGQVSEPVQTRFGWHLIKVEEKLTEAGEPKVRARHILLKYHASPETEDTLSAAAETFRVLAEERGLSDAAQAQGLEVRDTGYLQKGAVIPGLGQGTAWAVSLMFASPAGTVSRVGAVTSAYWVAQLAERREAGVLPLDEARARIERDVLNRQKEEVAGQRLEAVRAQVLAGQSLAAAAAAAGLDVRSPAPFARADMVPQVGRRNAFVAAAFSTPVGELSPVVRQSGGAYLLQVLERTPADPASFEAAREGLEEQLLRRRQNEAVQTWFAQLYDRAQIEDNRYRFYTF